MLLVTFECLADGSKETVTPTTIWVSDTNADLGYGTIERVPGST